MATKSKAKFKVLIADALDKCGMDILKKETLLEIHEKTGLSAVELKKIIGVYDAIIIRSATTLRKDIIEKGKKLKVIGRAGVGVDNVDLETATRRGIIVMNTPGSNTVSAAEHTVSLLLAMNRNIVQAHLSLSAGEWKRSKFIGSELAGKHLGILGYGRIGREVSKRALGLGMKVMAYDPYLSADSVKGSEVEVAADLKTLFKKADYITIHLPLTAETHHLFSDSAFKLMKKGVRIVNCARGGVVDEAALERAILSGKVRGAALDVFENEPPQADHPLLKMPQVIVTPHLGASTEEAQEQVSAAVAHQVADALLDRGVFNAVNFPSLDSKTQAVLSPWIVLAEKMGHFYIQLFEEDLREIRVLYSGEVADFPSQPLTTALLKGVFTHLSGSMVNFVNAPALASERGIKVTESRASVAGDFTNAIGLTVVTSKGKHTLAGTLFGNKDPRIVRIEDFHMDATPKGNMLVITNDDKPGVVGQLGTLLAEQKINIASMTLGRKKAGGYAITVINVDQEVSNDFLRKLRSFNHILDAKVVRL